MSALAANDMARLAVLQADIARAGPPCPSLHHTLGSELGRSGRLDLASVELERAVALDPTHAGAWTDLGNVHRLADRANAAERCYRRALILDPSNVAAGLGFASLEAETGRTSAAIQRLHALIAVDGNAGAVESLTEILVRLERHEEAKLLCSDVIARYPAHGVAHAGLGYILLKRDHRSEQALMYFDQALAGGYRNEQLCSNRGIALQDLGRLDEAIASYDEALRLSPGYPLAVFHRSLALLMRGEFGRAWPDYETRLVSEDRRSAPRELPVWEGEPTHDRLLVYGEQGIGDEIMFASCIPDLLERCPHVILACTGKLAGLFRRSFPTVEVITLQQAGDPGIGAAEPARRAVPIGSLPLYFRRDRMQFPRHEGYLRADPLLAAEYRERLAGLGSGLKIGLSWRGGLERTRRTLRSVTLADFTPILEVPGVHFVNLQYDSCGDHEPLAREIAMGRMAHWQEALDDYDRTAALVANLDMVVSVCTAVIHLAGAVGTPTRVLAPFSPEWRYGIAGRDMPWYPSVRIERQPAPGEWRPVIEAVCEEILSMTRDTTAR